MSSLIYILQMVWIFAFTHFNSVAQLCPILCDATDCSMPGFPAHHKLLELVQTHVRWVSDAIQPSHPLLSQSPPAFIFPGIRMFPKESVLCIRWPKYWSFSFSTSPSNKYSGLISFGIDWFDLLSVQGLIRVFSSTTVWKHQFFSFQPSLWSNSDICTYLAF